ncbi:MAG: RNA methyltransferase, partial [Methanosarcinales archaeon]
MTLDIQIILVQPKYEGNLGSVARVMKNFGFKKLILVNPCKIDKTAKIMSAHAKDVLENAIIVNSIEDAIIESDIVVGTTGRLRLPNRSRLRREGRRFAGVRGIKKDEHIRMPFFTPKELKNKLNGRSGVIAILFGREDNGLSNTELKLCDMILTIPTSEEYPIMNLSHAVAVVLYELSNIQSGEICLASGMDLRLLYEHFEEFLNDINYPEHKKNKTSLMIRRVLGRAELT